MADSIALTTLLFFVLDVKERCKIYFRNKSCSLTRKIQKISLKKLRNVKITKSTLSTFKFK
ncbi:MAG: hypothetical protein K2K89_08400, partial [Ruminococcus sp.]|nr:hypothetical protein [Ruminococcus sp.]